MADFLQQYEKQLKELRRRAYTDGQRQLSRLRGEISKFQAEGEGITRQIEELNKQRDIYIEKIHKLSQEETNLEKDLRTLAEYREDIA